MSEKFATQNMTKTSGSSNNSNSSSKGGGRGKGGTRGGGGVVLDLEAESLVNYLFFVSSYASVFHIFASLRRGSPRFTSFSYYFDSFRDTSILLLLRLLLGRIPHKTALDCLVRV